MSEHHSERSQSLVCFLDEQELTVSDFAALGPILDIGGGGEGVIGQLKGDQVVAIDRRRRELEEAPDGPLKIVMDAADMKFLDDTFEVATSFFSLMYMRTSLHADVFGEVFRVLKPGGRLLIWGASLPEKIGTDKEYVALHLTVNLPDRQIRTGYGTKWPAQARDWSYYEQSATSVGFLALDHLETGGVFTLELQKPNTQRS